MAEPKQLILVDGSSYLFRAFHALPPLVSSKGQATGAVKGVINMIRSLIKNYEDSNIAIVFDAKGKTFRSKIYKEYKATRPPMPDELRSQIRPIHQIIEAMGLPLLIIAEVEADDVIGTLSQQATALGISTLISTGDKDLAQLVNDKVTLINTMTNELLNSEAVEAKFGVGPNRIIDYLAMMGDKSDNIPGVPSVGPKTAVKWLQEYGSMEGIIENAEAIGGKVGEKLRENIDLLRLSYQLATIKMDVVLDVKIPELVAAEEDQQKLHELFSEMEFKSWINELEQQGVAGSAKEKPASKGSSENETVDVSVSEKDIDYKIVLEMQEFSTLLRQISGATEFSLSVETIGDHFLDQKILGIGICIEMGKAFYIPFLHDYDDVPTQLDLQECLAQLKPVI